MPMSKHDRKTILRKGVTEPELNRHLENAKIEGVNLSITCFMTSLAVELLGAEVWATDRATNLMRRVLEHFDGLITGKESLEEMSQYLSDRHSFEIGGLRNEEEN